MKNELGKVLSNNVKRSSFSHAAGCLVCTFLVFSEGFCAECMSFPADDAPFCSISVTAQYFQIFTTLLIYLFIQFVYSFIYLLSKHLSISYHVPEWPEHTRTPKIFLAVYSPKGLSFI